MSTEEIQFLEKAVINLTVENAKKQKEISKLKEDKDNYWKWYEQKRNLLEKKEMEIIDLNDKITELQKASPEELQATQEWLMGENSRGPEENV